MRLVDLPVVVGEMRAATTPLPIFLRHDVSYLSWPNSRPIQPVLVASKYNNRMANA